MEEFITIKNYARVELVIKKSKFIAEIFYTGTILEVENILKMVKKRESGAKHYCYAYRILESDIIEKMSDDGEPSGTAGGSIMNVLIGNNLLNVLVIVTRYFGGILLGTGGLVKAYSQVTSEALKCAETKKMQKATEMILTTNYSNLEQLKYYLNKIRCKNY